MVSKFPLNLANQPYCASVHALFPLKKHKLLLQRKRMIISICIMHATCMHIRSK